MTFEITEPNKGKQKSNKWKKTNNDDSNVCFVYCYNLKHTYWAFAQTLSSLFFRFCSSCLPCNAFTSITVCSCKKALRFTFHLYGQSWVTCPEVSPFARCLVTGEFPEDWNFGPGGETRTGAVWSREPPALRHGPLDNHTERMVHHRDSSGHPPGQSGAQRRCERRWVSGVWD